MKICETCGHTYWVSDAPGREGSGLYDVRALARSLAPPPPPPLAPPITPFVPASAVELAIRPEVSRLRPDHRIAIVMLASLAILASMGAVLAVGTERAPRQAAAALVDDAPVCPSQPAAAEVAHEPTPAPIESACTEVACVLGGYAEACCELFRAAPLATTVHEPAAATPASRPPLVLAAAAPALERADACTQASCVLGGYAEPCCESFRTPDLVPERLDRALLAEGIATIEARACASRFSGMGTVAISAKVDASGAVTDVTIKPTPTSSVDEPLIACVIAAVQRGTFARTARGGAFAYAWQF